MASLRGKVTFNGAPVSLATVTLYSAVEGVGVSAPLTAEGAYEIPGQIPAGTYQVFVVPEPPTPQQLEENPKLRFDEDAVPKKYRAPETSGIEVTLKAGQNQEDFDLVP